MLLIPFSVCLFVCHLLCAVEPFVTQHKNYLTRQNVLAMNSDHTPVLSNSIKANVAKNSLLCFGSILSVALLKGDKAAAIDLPECSDSVTIFRRTADNHEVTWKQHTASCVRTEIFLAVSTRSLALFYNMLSSRPTWLRLKEVDHNQCQKLFRLSWSVLPIYLRNLPI